VEIQPIPYVLSNKITAVFVYDETVPANFVYWDTIKMTAEVNASKQMDLLDKYSFNLYYNLPKGSLIDSISGSNMTTIIEMYLLSSKTSKNYSFLSSEPNSHTSSIPEWASYNPERKMFSFSTELFFKIKVDNSNIRMCSYRTSSAPLSQTSEHYQFANASRSCVCSNPVINSKSISAVTECLYSSASNRIYTLCPFYLSDEELIQTDVFKHKMSGESFSVKTTMYRSINDTWVIELKNVDTDVILHRLDYKNTVFGKDKSTLRQEALSVLSQVYSDYSEDYDIELNNTIQNVVINKKSKNSYISTLFSEDPNGNQISETLQAV
jgi:hypothetical protein